MARKSRFRAFRNALLHRGLRLASALGRRLSLPAARRWGRRVGNLAWHLVPRERRKALRGLEIAFPEKSPRERETIARAAFQHLGISLFEIAWLPNLTPDLFGRLTRLEGIEHFQAAADRGRGVVLFSGHCGNWEWMVAAIGMAGFRMNVIARHLYDERFNAFIVASRNRFGVASIGRGTSSSAKEILQTLRSGAVLGVLIDQNIRAESVEIPFFGVPALTPVGAARLAIRSGAMVLAGFIERGEDGIHYLRFQPAFETSREDDPVALTATMTAAIEEQIRRVPEQWVWMHERWKHRSS